MIGQGIEYMPEKVNQQYHEIISYGLVLKNPILIFSFKLKLFDINFETMFRMTFCGSIVS
jgi:hypothetical protein